jgi:hypothetical protein
VVHDYQNSSAAGEKKYPATVCRLPIVGKEFVYVVLTDAGEQLTLRPTEFAQKHGWKNDPAKAQAGLRP